MPAKRSHKNYVPAEGFRRKPGAKKARKLTPRIVQMKPIFDPRVGAVRMYVLDEGGGLWAWCQPGVSPPGRFEVVKDSGWVRIEGLDRRATFLGET